MTNIENAQIKALGDKVENQNGDISEIKSSIERIETALLGDKFNEDGGIIKRVKVIEIWKEEVHVSLSKTKFSKEWLKGWGGFLMALAAIIYEIVATWASLHKH